MNIKLTDKEVNLKSESDLIVLAVTYLTSRKCASHFMTPSPH